MSTFVLMELCKQSGVKNVIYQLLAPNITINLDEVEENRSYAVVIDKGIRYCLTGNPLVVSFCPLRQPYPPQL